MQRVTDPSLIQPERRRLGAATDILEVPVLSGGNRWGERVPSGRRGVRAVRVGPSDLAEEAGDEGVEAGDFVLEEVEKPEGGAVRVGADHQGDDVHRGA